MGLELELELEMCIGVFLVGYVGENETGRGARVYIIYAAGTDSWDQAMEIDEVIVI